MSFISEQPRSATDGYPSFTLPLFESTTLYKLNTLPGISLIENIHVNRDPLHKP